jgi:hypothetical protein
MYSKLVELIQSHSEELSQRVLKEMLSRKETESYNKLHRKEVYRRIYEVYNGLGSWLSKDTPRDDLKEHYTRLGKRRFNEGIPLKEVVMALLLIKRYLWLYILETYLFKSTFEIYQSLEMNNRVVLFFDRAIYFSSMGFEEAQKEAEERAKLAQDMDAETGDKFVQA